MRIHLFPCPIIEGQLNQLPKSVIDQIKITTIFVVERAKTARRFLKQIGHTLPIQEIILFELDKHNPEQGLYSFLEDLDKESMVGILSEAGCPGIADPGHRVVSWAHRKGYKVIPHIGPSSILLALMATGLNGQHFTFHGYLPAKKGALQSLLKKLEQSTLRTGSSQIFIEAPYRNQFIIETVSQTLSDRLFLAGCFDLGGVEEEIIVQKPSQWKKEELVRFHKRPAVYIIGL